MFRMEHRYDILRAANSARFYLRHYARGIYSIASLHPLHLPVNRMLFPLRNPNGECNYIRDRHRTYVLKPGHLYFIPAFYPAKVYMDEELYFLSIQTVWKSIRARNFFQIVLPYRNCLFRRNCRY